jgi:hypothetical protein
MSAPIRRWLWPSRPDCAPASVAYRPELGAFTVEGPVQAEIIVLALMAGELVLTGPCGAAPWYVEVAQGADPVGVVAAITRLNLGEPAVVHSTSWRHARGGVVLTFVAVIDAAAVGTLATVPVGRHELARGAATAAPRQVSTGPVIEHATWPGLPATMQPSLGRCRQAGSRPSTATSPSLSATCDHPANPTAHALMRST